MSFIKTVHTLYPQFSYSTEELMPFFMRWVEPKGEAFAEKAKKILIGANVKKRHSIIPLDVLFTPRSFEKSNALYKEKAIELGKKVLLQALENANLKSRDLDCLITTSCTGFMIPSLNSYLINECDLRDNIKHIPITEIGCTAGATSLIYAHDYLKAYPQHHVAIINIEFPSNTIQLNDYSWDNVVGTALFADGVACTILSGESGMIKLRDADMFHLKESSHLLGYNITDSGLKMNLDKALPIVVKDNFLKVVERFLGKNALTISDISHFLVHPGGIRILEKIESALSEFDRDVNLSRLVMESYGNLSSATLPCILNEYVQSNNQLNEFIVLLSFGPGFSAHQLLAERVR